MHAYFRVWRKAALRLERFEAEENAIMAESSNFTRSLLEFLQSIYKKIYNQWCAKNCKDVQYNATEETWEKFQVLCVFLSLQLWM